MFSRCMGLQAPDFHARHIISSVFISSEEGVHQGDTLGSALFATAIHPVLKELQSTILGFISLLIWMMYSYWVHQKMFGLHFMISRIASLLWCLILLITTVRSSEVRLPLLLFVTLLKFLSSLKVASS